jgi:hypothetical protein
MPEGTLSAALKEQKLLRSLRNSANVMDTARAGKVDIDESD